MKQKKSCPEECRFNRDRPPHDAGNALFLILIAVALFAALSYAMTRSGAGGGGGISNETAELNAAAIIQYAGQVGQAVDRLLVLGACTDTQLSFENNIVTGYAYANLPGGDKSCHIFDVAGGGVDFKKPPPGANQGEDWLFTYARFVKLNGDTGLTAASTDLIMVLPNITLALCKKLNAKLPIPTVFSVTPPEGNAGFGSFGNPFKFTGTYGAPALDNQAISPKFDGTTVSYAACFQMTAGVSTGEYWFMYILKSRP